MRKSYFCPQNLDYWLPGSELKKKSPQNKPPLLSSLVLGRISFIAQLIQAALTFKPKSVQNSPCKEH